MSFVDKVRKNGAAKSSVADINFKLIEEENDFPFAEVDFLRIGSAHAVERLGDRERLRESLEPMALELRSLYESEQIQQSVIFVDK
jgi:hypothetical protein